MLIFTSFKDVIENVYCAGILNNVAEYVERNADKLEEAFNTTNSVFNPTLYGIEVKFISNIREYKNKTFFDVIISAELKISKTVSRIYETDYIEQCLRLSCSVEDNLTDFKIYDIDAYNKTRNNSKNSLSEYLVHIISKEQLDDVAESFLAKYYPEALEKPMPIPAREVARRMGLIYRKYI